MQWPGNVAPPEMIFHELGPIYSFPFFERVGTDQNCFGTCIYMIAKHLGIK